MALITIYYPHGSQDYMDVTDYSVKDGVLTLTHRERGVGATNREPTEKVITTLPFIIKAQLHR